MANEAEQFRLAFREEARELLVELESCLLELNEKGDAGELVARVFRALHTIKGSGAMFGFDTLAAFTHRLENAFDEVRQGRLRMTPALVDLTLAALDQIRRMVEEDTGEAVADSGPCAAILERVSVLMEESGAAKTPAAAGTERGDDSGRTAHEAGLSETGPSVAGASERGAAVHVWRILFAPGPDLMRNGADPLLLLRELGQMGQLTAEASMEDIPSLGELEPERCYLRWKLRLETPAGSQVGPDAIRDVFIFVEDACTLEIACEGIADGATESSPAEAEAKREADGEQAVAAGDGTARAHEEKRKNPGRRDGDKESAGSLRVPAARLDQLVDLVGELVTVQARLTALAARSEDAEVQAVGEEIERLTSALRENSMTLRMVPVRATFERFRRLVHDLGRDLGKNVELTIEGAETELDKTVIDQLGDPLMHLIRNSMDHGVETPEVRAAAGKNRGATIHLAARHAGASVLIEVSDDGAGIDREAVRARAIERGLACEGAALTEAEIFGFIFQPGFSTAREVTDLSGRGVGMDVVRQRVEGLRGTIEVSSRRGQGTTVTLRLPLTLAIIDGLLVTVGDGSYVLPLSSTLECIELTREDVAAANGKHVVYVRGEMVPYIRLRETFGVRTEAPRREQIMVVENDGGRCGLVVDRVLGDCQTVIRNLGSLYRHVQSVSGATILGDGTVALILDPQRLVQEAMRTKAQEGRGRVGPPC
ncbi:MAG TPA: chemotaxis protein CheA [Acidobacteriaceae bacterium]|jgi:two-component system chemotaxis sensor kinase CheA|nr:chemotaxis protein CheA [Acidobacteriaceae bacterium]